MCWQASQDMDDPNNTSHIVGLTRLQEDGLRSIFANTLWQTYDYVEHFSQFCNIQWWCSWLSNDQEVLQCNGAKAPWAYVWKQMVASALKCCMSHYLGVNLEWQNILHQIWVWLDCSNKLFDSSLTKIIHMVHIFEVVALPSSCLSHCYCHTPNFVYRRVLFA